MKRIFFFLILLFALPFKVFSQSFSSQNEAVNELMEKHIALGKARNAMPGYRVQIFFGDNREEANTIKSDFLRIHPNMGAYLVYQQPNFKIRVGDFKTRLSAMELLSEVQTRFPMAFIVKDYVKLPR
ncbi:MAG: hypothetical protein RL491_330 [Bacteroidota bacterium]|jgi:hypothetical protein